MKEIKVGYSEENDIVIKDNSISRQHAIIECLPGEEYWIRDLSSTNGVYVNNRRVKRFPIDEKDQLILGSKLIDNKNLFYRVRKILAHRKTDYSKEYEEILNLMKQYFNKKTKIQGASKWPAILRLSLSIILIGVLFYKSDLIPDPNIRYALILVIGSLPILLNVFFDNKEKKQEQLDMLKLEYENQLKCPKCGTSLINTTPVYLKARGRCINDKCQAVFKVD